MAVPFLAMLLLTGLLTASLPAVLALHHPAVYCLAVAAPATLARVGVFPWRPAPGVANEAERWRRRLLPRHAG